MIKSYSPVDSVFGCGWLSCSTTTRRRLTPPSDCSDRAATEAVCGAHTKPQRGTALS